MKINSKSLREKKEIAPESYNQDTEVQFPHAFLLALLALHLFYCRSHIVHHLKDILIQTCWAQPPYSQLLGGRGRGIRKEFKIIVDYLVSSGLAWAN